MKKHSISLELFVFISESGFTPISVTVSLTDGNMKLDIGNIGFSTVPSLQWNN